MADPVWSLWYRPGRKHPWERVFTGDSARACVFAMADDRTHPHGDWWWGEGDRPPRNVNLTIPRRKQKVRDD